MKLYYAPGSCSLSPHIVLREVGAAFELEQVDLATKTTQSGKDYLQICSKGYVPALELDTGDVITEGVAIIQYIADQFPDAQLAPPNGGVARAKLQGVLNFISAELHNAFSPLFTPSASEEQKSQARAKIAKCFEYIEARLKDGRPFLMGEDYTIADAYLFIVTGWAHAKNVDLTPWPNLIDFAARVGARPAVKEAIDAEQAA